MSYTFPLSQPDSSTVDTTGHFRIGPVSLQIPPDSLRLVRDTNTDEVMPLRSKYSYGIRTGQARWNLTIQWRALLGQTPDGSTDFSQWEDVRTILAMLKAAPFMDVENVDVRRILTQTDITLGHVRLAFALRQLTIQTSTDIVDGLDCTLHMSFFNYTPFSKDFAFLGKDGDKHADGNSSPALTSYLENWKTLNLDKPYTQTADLEGAETMAPWASQNPDALNFSWRKYYTQEGAPASVNPQAPTDDGDLLADLPVDHFTSFGKNDAVTFRYKTRKISLTGGAFESNENDLYVNQMAVTFTNNLAVIPLAGFQYPTFQHIGPATSMISFSLQQKGYDATGLPLISEMVTSLEEQFITMRTQWRKTSSVHRMQAIFVENQFLNMLGIFGMMENQFTVQPVEESSDIVQAQLVARQYENIFESLSSYAVKGPLGSSAPQFDKIFQSNAYKNMTPESNAAIALVDQFQKARLARDQKWLVNFLGKNLKSLPLLVSTTTSPAPLTTAEVAAFKGMARFASSAVPYYNDVAVTGQFTFSDILFLASQNGPGLLAQEQMQTYLNRIEGVDRVKTDAALDGVYTALFRIRTEPDNDPQFKAQLDNLLENPQLKKVFLQQDGKDILNGHGAYNDMGLAPSMGNGGNLNPASYFYDPTEDVLQQASAALIQQIPDMMFGAKSGYASLNKQAGSTTAAVVNAAELAVTEGNPAGILARTNLPNYSMRAAFPTYKLFLMEEDNLRSYHMMDDFYSYSGVLDMETQTDRNGSTAIIHLTNLAGLLTHTLFDGSIDGKQERDFNKYTPETATTASGTVSGPGGIDTAISATSDFSYGNMQEGVDVNGRPNQVPLRYFALQTGSKIQIRQGFDDDPDRLTPVFQGIVTNISGTDVLEIIAQGFQMELMTLDDSIQRDGRSVLSDLGNGFNAGSNWVSDVLQGHGLDAWHDVSKFFTDVGKRPAFGGVRAYGDGGDASSVIRSMLKTASAKHFGHWQVGQATDRYLKGFTWEAALGRAIGSGTRIGSALLTAYDRRDENILVDHFVNYDSTVTTGRAKRSYNFESPTVFQWGSPPQYHIPDSAKVTPWDVIRDVSRRYPEYTLAVKNYGFPTAADATLVFAHPLDWYASRMPTIGEDSKAPKVKQSDASYFQNWWKSGGKQRFIDIVNQYYSGDLTLKQQSDKLYREAYLANPVNGRKSSITYGPVGEAIATQVTAGNIEGFIGQMMDSTTSSLANKFFKFSALNASEVVAAQNALILFQRDMQHMVGIARNPAGTLAVRNADIIKPVRRFHYVDHNVIIHNGITVNDNFNNAIKLAGDVIKLNGLTPDHHLRILDADDLVIDVVDNIKQGGSLHACYAQSFLRDEVGKMYGGEIVLSSIPEIEYGDILMILDPSTGISGPVEVDSVIHSFDQESGSITIVRPRTWVMVNEAASANIMAMIWQTIPQLGALGRDFGPSYDQSSQLTKTVTQVAVGSTAVALGALVAPGIGAVASSIAGLEAIGAVSLLAGPPGWVLGGLLAAGVLVGGTAMATMVSKKNFMLNPMMIVPLTRNSHPWVGGLQGYRISDISNLINTNWDRWVTDEIAPTIAGYRLLRAGLDPFSQDKTAAAQKALAPPSLAFPVGKAGSAITKLLSRISSTIAGYIEAAANNPQHPIPLRLLQALVYQESGGNLAAYNKTGASGIMQLMPKTAAMLEVTSEPQSQINGGAKYLYAQYQRFGSWDYALAAYNDGPGNVHKNLPTIPNGGKNETRNYVVNILANAGLPPSTHLS